VLVRAAFALLAAAALVPFASDLDAHLDWALEAWRTCRGLSIADRVSDLVQPVGVTVLVLATGRALWRRRPAREVLGILASLAVGTLLIGALKDVLDRPRPGAEFLTPGGGSFPSGHVGNTILNATAIGLHDGIRRFDDQRTGCHNDANSAGVVHASPSSRRPKRTASG